MCYLFLKLKKNLYHFQRINSFRSNQIKAFNSIEFQHFKSQEEILLMPRALLDFFSNHSTTFKNRSKM